MAHTLADVIAQIRDQLSDYPRTASASDTGDGVTIRFKLPDSPIVTGSVLVSTDSTPKTETTDWSLDYDTGWVTFVVAPSSGSDVVAVYQHALFQDGEIVDAINGAIQYCLNDFYTIKVFDKAEGDAATSDFPIPLCSKVVRVEWFDGTAWKKLNNWETRYDSTYNVTADTSSFLSDTTSTTLSLAAGEGWIVHEDDLLYDVAGSEIVKVTSVDSDSLTVTRGYYSTAAENHLSAATWRKWNDKFVHFSSPPSDGKLKITYQAWPEEFDPDVTTDTLERTINLPARSLQAIVYYASSKLLMKRYAARLLDGHYSADGDLDPVKLRDAIQSFKLMCDAELSKTKMRPQTGRVRLS